MINEYLYKIPIILFINISFPADSEPLTSGSQWRWFSTDEVIFKVSPIQYEEEFKDIFTSDNTPINLSANLLLQIEKGSTPKLLTDFGEKWYDNNIQVQFVKYVRDEISKYPMKELTSKREIYDNVEMVVNEKVQQIIKDKKKIRIYFSLFQFCTHNLSQRTHTGF